MRQQRAKRAWLSSPLRPSRVNFPPAGSCVFARYEVYVEHLSELWSLLSLVIQLYDNGERGTRGTGGARCLSGRLGQLMISHGHYPTSHARRPALCSGCGNPRGGKWKYKSFHDFTNMRISGPRWSTQIHVQCVMISFSLVLAWHEGGNCTFHFSGNIKSFVIRRQDRPKLLSAVRR